MEAPTQTTLPAAALAQAALAAEGSTAAAKAELLRARTAKALAYMMLGFGWIVEKVVVGKSDSEGKDEHDYYTH